MEPVTVTEYPKDARPPVREEDLIEGRGCCPKMSPPSGTGMPWACTRSYGHDGPHEAGILGGRIAASWES